MTQEQYQWLKDNGYDPAVYDVDDQGNIFENPVSAPATQKKMSVPRAFGTSFAGSLLPSAVGLGGAKLGMMAGAPLGPVGIGIGALAGGLGAGYLAGKGQEAALESFAPEAIAEMQRAQTDQPVASYLGGFAPNALAFRPSLQGMSGLLRPTVRGEETLRAALSNPNFIAPAANVAANVGASTAGQLINVAEGGEFSAPRFAADVALGTLFNRPTALGRAMGFQDLPQGRPVESPELAPARERAEFMAYPPREFVTPRAERGAEDIKTPGVNIGLEAPEQYFTAEGKRMTEKAMAKDYTNWWKSETEPTTELLKGAAEEVKAQIPRERLKELSQDPEVGEVLRDPSKMPAFIAKQADQTLEDVFQMMERRRSREFATAEEAANQKAFQELRAERGFTQKTVTPEATDLLSKVDEGGVPGFITNNLRRIAQENGIVVTDADTPNTVIQKLRDLAAPSDVEAAYAARQRTPEGEAQKLYGPELAGPAAPKPPSPSKAASGYDLTQPQIKQNATEAAREVYTRLQRPEGAGENRITQQDIDFAAEVAARRGLKIELDRAFAGDQEVRGMYFVDPKTGERIIRVNPLMATADTAIHEVGHDIFTGVTNKGMRRSLMDSALDSPAYKAELAARLKEGMPEAQARDIALEEGLIQAFGEKMPGINRGELRSWFKAFKASIKQLATGKLSPEDALAWMHYASTEAVPWKGVAVGKTGEERMQRSVDEQPFQEISSAGTSRPQVPAVFKSDTFIPRGTNIDIGAGKYDLGKEYLESERGVTESVPFDPFNRSVESNRMAVERLQSGERFGTATIPNTLNVIAETSARDNVILQAARAIEPEGVAYFQIWEGDKSGIGGKTTAGFQNNKKTSDYVAEVRKHFGDVRTSGNIIVASNPKVSERKAFWQLSSDAEGPSIRYQRGQESELGYDYLDKHIKKIEDSFDTSKLSPEDVDTYLELFDPKDAQAAKELLLNNRLQSTLWSWADPGGRSFNLEKMAKDFSGFGTPHQNTAKYYKLLAKYVPDFKNIMDEVRALKYGHMMSEIEKSPDIRYQRGLLSKIQTPSELDYLVSKGGPFAEVGTTIKAAANTRDFKQGQWSSKYSLTNALPEEARVRLLNHLAGEFDSGVRSTPAADIRAAYDQLRNEYLPAIVNDYNTAGFMVRDTAGLRARGSNPTYFPLHAIADEVTNILTTKQGSPEWDKLKADFINWNTQLRQADGASLAEAQRYANEKFDEKLSITAKPPGIESGIPFSGARKPEGYPLPPSWRSNDIIDILNNYTRRSATDFAYQQHVESSPVAMAALGAKTMLNNQPIPANILQSTAPVINDPSVQSVLREYRGTPAQRTEGTLPSIGRFVSAATIGPISKTGDIGTSMFKGLAYLPGSEYASGLATFTNKIADWAALKERSYASGLNKRDAAENMRQVLGIAEDSTAFMDKAARVLSKATFVNDLESVARVIAQGWGETIVGINKKLALGGDKNATQMLDTLTPDWRTRSDADLAAQVGRLLQGSYDMRQLPASFLEGAAAPYLTWSKWSMGQYDSFMKYALQPAMQGNMKPLIGQMVIGLLGGGAISAVQEWLNNREGKDITWRELESWMQQNQGEIGADGGMMLGQKLLTMAQKMGTFGFAGDLVKMTIDAAAGGTAQGVATMPAMDAIYDTTKRAAAALKALDDGEDFGLVAKALVQDSLTSHLQVARVARNWLDEDENLRYDDRRRQRLYDKLMGLPSKGGTFAVSYSNLSEREFERGEITPETGEEALALVTRAREEATTPEDYASRIRKYKTSQNQIMPSMERQPMKAARYLSWLEGTEEGLGSETMRRYMTREYENKYRKSLIEGLSGLR